MYRSVLMTLAFVGSLVSYAVAGVSVGDKPAMEFKAVGSGNVSLAGLKNKIVVIDFWATWCGPCMAEAGHMVELNSKYASQGVQIIGISLDDDVNSMTQVAKQKGFIWPQCCDGQGWQAKFAMQFGVKSIPRTFIISPDGDVLWVGHPAQIDGPLESAMKEHPPRLIDPEVKTAALKALEGVAAALKDGNTSAALKALGTVPPESKVDPDIAKQLTSYTSELEATAAKMVTDVEPIIEAKQYVAAAAKLLELSKALPGTAAGTSARKRLDAVLALPAAKAAIEADKRNTLAAAELDTAEKLKAAGKDDAAYLKYKSITKTFAGSPAADSAAAAVATYEKDNAFIKRVNETAGAGKAKSLLSLAASYAQSGNTEMAKKKYQEVIQTFPGTSFAETAKTELSKLR